MSTPSESISALIAPTVEALGLELIRVTYGGGRKPTLQVMAERPDGSMSVEDCALLSREISVLLDVEDPLEGEYLLEVSSPGIDRPLTRRKDFERWLGFEVKIELSEQIDGRRRFRGELVQLEGDIVRLKAEEGLLDLPFADIAKAKLVLTDALLAAAAPARSDAAPKADTESKESASS